MAAPKVFWLVALLLSLGMGALAASFHRYTLDWDEVDYVNSARLGFWQNWTDSGSLSPTEFARFGIAKWQQSEAHLPPGYAEEADPLIRRHYHPPLICYLMVPVAWSSDERVLRLAQVLGAIVLSGTVFAVYRMLTHRVSGWGVLSLGLLMLWITPLLFASISTHGWMSVWTMVCTFLAGVWLARGDGRAGLLACLALALSMTTLEMGIVVAGSIFLAVVSAALLRVGSDSGPIGRYFIAGSAVTALFLALLWPGAWLKASLIKSWSYHLYRLRLGDEYASAGSLMPANFMALLPALLVVGLAAFAFAVSRRGATLWWPAVVVTLTYTTLVLPSLVNPRYLLPALAPLLAWAAVGVDLMPHSLARFVAAFSLVVTVAVSSASFAVAPADEQLAADIRWLGHVLENREALADSAPVLLHYLGAGYRIRTVRISRDGDAVLLREQGVYRQALRGDLRGRILVLQKHMLERYTRRQADRKLHIEALRECRFLERPTVVLFDCASE